MRKAIAIQPVVSAMYPISTGAVDSLLSDSTSTLQNTPSQVVQCHQNKVQAKLAWKQRKTIAASSYKQPPYPYLPSPQDNISRKRN